jgi:hypothetical protein
MQNKTWIRAAVAFAPLALIAAPAAAEPTQPEKVQIPSELTNPATAERLADVMQALSKALLELPVGEIKAAAEGRPATEHDKGVTVRDLGRKEDPNFERKLDRQIAEAKPMIAQSMKALAEALPAMLQGLSKASEAVERAAANMPDPNYPKR